MIPSIWLQALIEDTTGYQRLLRESGNLPIAAYRLAKAKCMTREHHTPVPTRVEVRAAAREIAERLDSKARIPSCADLASELEADGFAVM